MSAAAGRSGRVEILVGDARARLRGLPSDSVDCCVTSPPYYGLRDYGCDGQIGLEPTPDAYVAEMVGIFAEVRRVLKPAGTLWLNLGDSYAASRGGTHQPAETLAGGRHGKTSDSQRVNRGRMDGKNPTRDAAAIGLKHKDLIGIPWRVAFALQADGWWMRQDIVWAKPNPMPESVRDRCTKAHEYLFLLSKAERYHFDAAAIAEVSSHKGRVVKYDGTQKNVDAATDPKMRTRVASTTTVGETRNRRSVWTIPTQPFAGAHFATMPPRLAMDCILAGCPAGGTVLDPFGGAGTTALAASRLGRFAILIELNADYAAIAKRRIEDEAPMFADVSTEAAG